MPTESPEPAREGPPEWLGHAETALRSGLTVALATDTVWGVAADPARRAAVERLHAQKRRPLTKVVQLLCADADAAARFAAPGALGQSAWPRLATLWPGALTVVVPAAPDCPAWLVQGGRVGLRVPAGKQLGALLTACGGALAASSLNVAGEAPARTFEQAQQLGIADLILPGPDAPGDASTVYDLAARRVLRAGALDERVIRAALWNS